ncbi:MAG TPA: thioredoxin domain-containing protein [Balneolales bacterium]|nr:thioredoxin domain-containing protein [Balneolales bacterium]
MTETSMHKVHFYSLTTILIFMMLGFIFPKAYLLKEKKTEPVRTVSKSEWDTLTSWGQTFGPEKAPITIVEFVDFQCSHCKHFADVLSRYTEEHPNQIKVIVHNFPLPQHHQADMAAISAICVAKSGNYGKYYHLLFKNQDKFYSQPWDSLARLAGVHDLKTFNKRLKQDKSVRHLIRKDVQLGMRVGLRETPTIIINRVLYSGPLTYRELKQAVQYNLQSNMQ